jgi:hypothetical protein
LLAAFLSATECSWCQHAFLSLPFLSAYDNDDDDEHHGWPWL